MSISVSDHWQPVRELPVGFKGTSPDNTYAIKIHEEAIAMYGEVKIK